MTYLAYPGAMHSRFEHSLGVMHMATRAFDSIVSKERQLVIEEFQQYPEFADDALARARQLVRLLGLLHDSGHPAFSHAAEATVPTGEHESVSAYAVRDVLGKTLDSVYFAGISDLLAKMISETEGVPVLRQCVAGELDMDRADYLLRDSLHCGVSYGLFDSERLIESLTAIVDPDIRQLHLAIERGGEHPFEAMILARYQMTTQVYLHKIRRIYDYYLTKYMQSWGLEHHRTFEDVLRYDDILVLASMRDDAKANEPRSSWARRLIDRNHHKVVYETGDNADHFRLNHCRRILETLQQEFEGTDLYLDDAKFSIHKLFVPGEQEEAKVENLYIKERNGGIRLLTQDSAILGKIPKRLRTVRIFADASGPEFESLRERARELENRS